MMPLARTLPVLLLLTATLSGCLGADEHDHDSHDHGEEEGSESQGNQTLNLTLPVPLVLVYVDGAPVELVNDTLALVAGSAATFDASNSTGDNLTFAWDFGDGEVRNESAVEFTFAEAGVFNVSLTITDQHNQTANASLTVEVELGGPVSGTFLREDKKTFTSSVTATYQTGTGDACGTYGTTAVFNHDWTIPAAEANGTAIKVSRFVVKLSGAGTYHTDSDVFLFDPKGKQIGKGDGPSATETIDIKGSFDPGKYQVRIVACRVVNGSATATSTASLVVA